jgi:GH24 family phage-related lysozyme (muramidase)
MSGRGTSKVDVTLPDVDKPLEQELAEIDEVNLERGANPDPNYQTKLATFIEESEGRVPYLYDDKNKKPWGTSKKGDPTIGIGFNVNRPDADKLLRKIGSSKAAVMKGENLSVPQQNRLLALSVEETDRFLRRHFKGVKMENHRWIALTSLAFNSRWDDNGPTLIGPGLTAAIKAGDWNAAQNEIRKNSGGGVSAGQQKGIDDRRQREANMFRGTTMPPAPRRKPNAQ